jgi:hypothetical protein
MRVLFEALTNSSNLVVSFHSLCEKILLNLLSKLSSPEIVSIVVIMSFAVCVNSHCSGKSFCISQIVKGEIFHSDNFVLNNPLHVSIVVGAISSGVSLFGSSFSSFESSTSHASSQNFIIHCINSRIIFANIANKPHFSSISSRSSSVGRLSRSVFITQSVFLSLSSVVEITQIMDCKCSCASIHKPLRLFVIFVSLHIGKFLSSIYFLILSSETVSPEIKSKKSFHTLASLKI